jgi:hypothetical protein
MAPVGIILGASAVLSALTAVWNAYRKHPDQEMAEHLRTAQLEAVKRASNKMDLEQRVHERFAQERSTGLRKLVETKQGLDEGWISPAEQGIPGGGLAARDLPMVNLMAAQLGMDPADLVARFDPARSNLFVPEDRRGNTPPRPLSSLLPKPPTEMMGPAQMNPQGGFGQ